MTGFIPILYGTETGTAEECATNLAQAIQDYGLPAKSIDLFDFTCEDLCELPLVFIVSSTHGNGDPPENAIDLMDYLELDAPDLKNVRYAVCGLGDTTYPYFAQCGKDFDAHMEKNGGIRILKRVDCDVNFEVPFSQFKDSALSYLKENEEEIRSLCKISPSSELICEAPIPKISSSNTSLYATREHPTFGTLREMRLLSQKDSNKETMHYEIDITDAGISYVSGDCIGVIPQNNPKEVRSILNRLKFSGEESVLWKGKVFTLYNVLLEKACLQHISVDLLRWCAQSIRDVKAIVNGGSSAMEQYIGTHHIFDLVQLIHIPIQEQSFVSLLQSIKPRLYSIASSPNKYPNAVHFCIETIRYQRHSRSVEGVASTWFADRITENTKIPLYLHSNNNFRLPSEHAPVIMIGPGTGVAPFIAFLQEKEELSFGGEMWLFFGHQHEQKDYLYQSTIEQAQTNGTLNRLDLAWSRDQNEKVYVQHKLWERRIEIWDWYTRGAYFYICGDAKKMAVDVDATLKRIAEENGKEGTSWIQELEAQNRYQRDIY